MNILVAAREYPPFGVGGVARHTFYLVKYLKKLGVSCKVLSFGDPKCSRDDVVFVKPSSSIISRSNRPLAHDARIPLDILRLTKVARELIKNRSFDIIHIEEPYVGAFVTHERKVTTVHDTSYGELKSILHSPINPPNIKRALFYILLGFWLERVCIATSKIVIVPYKHVKEELVRVYGTREEMIRVIRNGLELPVSCSSDDKAEAKKILALPTDELLIFAAAQHVARKRLDTLVEAVRLLREEGVEGFRVVIAGDGPVRPYILNLVGKYGLEKYVHLPGWVSENQLVLYYMAADVFAMTSEYEAGPISLLEAMSFGAAIVSSMIDGFPRLMRDGVEALLFPVGDYRALSDHLRRLLNDGHMRARLSSSARLFVRRFDWKSVAEETKHLYGDML